MASEQSENLILIGSSGNIGSALRQALSKKYRVIGFDRDASGQDIKIDIGSDASVELAFQNYREKYGDSISAVIHLAAYFDFTGQTSPLYDAINVKGTQRVLQALQAFKVDRFIYSSTMLVHQAGKPGTLTNEDTDIAPKWAYPQSKAEAERIIREFHGTTPYVILRLAGVYNNNTVVPTLAHQIANIYERDVKSILHAGDINAGQAFIHQDDMIALFTLVVERRNQLDRELELLAGEPAAMSYCELQNRIGSLIHGEQDWKTLSLPSSVAKAGAWAEEKLEIVVPDAFDQGEKPFIKPFMIDLAEDHYELDISKAEALLDWHPGHRINNELPKIIDSLKAAPEAWYKANSLTMPAWMEAAVEKHNNPEQLINEYEENYKKSHADTIWAHFLNIALGFWLLASPFTLGYARTGMIKSDLICGVLIIVFGSIALSSKPMHRKARWLLGIIGIWITFAPLVFWTESAGAYLNGTLVGTLVASLALLPRPFPGLSPVAVQTGPDIPPGWAFSPSDWFQRLPIIALAFVGFFISRYLAAYQLGHIDGVWDPFFAGPATPSKNGTEEIITSNISEAWPVPDAGLGALTYLLEIITGIMGSRARWRTMPWLVLLFGFMIVPLGAISITFIIIQPILLDTWCTLCLIAGAAMLLQVPYSFDEIVATIQFLKRRAENGRPWIRIIFTGDTDEGDKKPSDADSFHQAPIAILKNMVAGGVSLPWNLGLSVLIGIWLMLTQITIGAGGGMANADHLIGALVVTITVSAFAEVMRPLRFLNIFLGLAIMISSFVLTSDIPSLVSSIVCGLALIVLSIPRGKIDGAYGNWQKVIL